MNIMPSKSDPWIIESKSGKYINLTAMAQPKGKLIGDYLRTGTTKMFLDDLSVITGHPVEKLVRVKTGKYGGAWGHPLVAEDVQKWLERSSKKANECSPHTEKGIQNNLAKKLKGATEVPTASGKIDILTEQEIIEVKEVSKWKCAVGQVLVYGIDYPKHKKRIHLFGKASPSFLEMIRQYCMVLSVEMTWEP